MKNTIRITLSLILMLLFVSVAVIEHDAYARAGGSRSFGSSGSRSYSAPQRSTSSPATPSQPTSPVQQPAGGGFLRGMAGGLLGGLLGGMLFSSLGFGGTGGFGGSGIGLFEILLFCGIGYFIYSLVKKKRREEALAYQGASQQGGYTAEQSTSYGTGSRADGSTNEGIAHIRQMDPSFNEDRFRDTVMDIFFKIQGAWTNRDLSPASVLLTDEMKNIFQQDIDQMLKDKKVNRLENIAVRKVEVVEAWQEAGQDFAKAVFTANLLDYTTDDATGSVIAGSKTEPVKFEECWTFTRSVGNNPWKLSAISQM
jgi:predicted lipid-binding transport protein (Tim44 family)